MSKHQETLTRALAEKIVDAARPDNQEETSAALAQFSEINADAAEVLATQFVLRAEFPRVQSLSLAAAQALGKMDRSWIVLDGLTSLTPELAKPLARGGALSLKGVKNLEKDTAKELSRHRCSLLLNGVEKASDAAIEALAETEAELSLDSLADISDAALEKLIRFRGKTLILGLRQLNENQARILELYHGDYLGLDALSEVTTSSAKSFSRLQCRLSLGEIRTLSDKAAERLSTFKGSLVLSGRLNFSNSAAASLQQIWRLSFSGWIDLPEHAYETIHSDSLINKEFVNGWLMESASSRNPVLPGRVITAAAAEAIARSSTTVMMHLQELPDKIADVLSKHKGYLSLSTERPLSKSALSSLACRKYRKRTNWALSLGLTELDASCASEIAQTTYPLNFYNLRQLSDDAAEALALHKSDLHIGPLDSKWHTVFSAKAITALAKKEGTINAENPKTWARKAKQRLQEK